VIESVHTSLVSSIYLFLLFPLPGLLLFDLRRWWGGQLGRLLFGFLAWRLRLTFLLLLLFFLLFFIFIARR
jgi:hypothetical protein